MYDSMIDILFLDKIVLIKATDACLHALQLCKY